MQEYARCVLSQNMHVGHHELAVIKGIVKKDDGGNLVTLVTALSSTNVETRAAVPAAGLSFSSCSGALSSNAALSSAAVGGVGASYWRCGCAPALGSGVTSSGDGGWFLLELLPVKVGTCIGPC